MTGHVLFFGLGVFAYAFVRDVFPRLIWPRLRRFLGMEAEKAGAAIEGKTKV